MITVAALAPSLDLTYAVDGLRLGAIHRTPPALAVAGGKGLNMVRAAATMGAHCRVVALLGGRTGQRIADLLRSEGVDLVAVDSGAETRICVSIADPGRGDLTELYADSPDPPPEVLADFAGVVAGALSGPAGWLSFSGRAPGRSAQILAELITAGHTAGQRVAVDTHSEALPSALERRPELVKINRGEAAQLLERPQDDDLAEMAALIHDRTGGMVVLTDGGGGAVGCDGSRILRAGDTGVRGAYPVGSGDAFLGGMVAALDQGADLADGLVMGMACGTANALVPGPGRLDRATAYALARTITLDPV